MDETFFVGQHILEDIDALEGFMRSHVFTLLSSTWNHSIDESISYEEDADLSNSALIARNIGKRIGIRETTMSFGDLLDKLQSDYDNL